MNEVAIYCNGTLNLAGMELKRKLALHEKTHKILEEKDKEFIKKVMKVIDDKILYTNWTRSFEVMFGLRRRFPKKT